MEDMYKLIRNQGCRGWLAMCVILEMSLGNACLLWISNRRAPLYHL